MPSRIAQRAFRTRAHHIEKSIGRVHGLFSRADVARATGRSQARVGQWAETWDWPDPVEFINDKPVYCGWDIAAWLDNREQFDAAAAVLTWKSNGRTTS